MCLCKVEPFKSFAVLVATTLGSAIYLGIWGALANTASLILFYMYASRVQRPVAAVLAALSSAGMIACLVALL